MTAEIECREEEAPPRSHGTMNKLIFVSVFVWSERVCVCFCHHCNIERFSLWNFVEPLQCFFLFGNIMCVCVCLLRFYIKKCECAPVHSNAYWWMWCERILETDWKQASSVYRSTRYISIHWKRGRNEAQRKYYTRMEFLWISKQTCLIDAQYFHRKATTTIR